MLLSRSFRGEHISLSFPASGGSLHSCSYDPFPPSKPTTDLVLLRSQWCGLWFPSSTIVITMRLSLSFCLFILFMGFSVKSKGRKERYTHLNTEFQRTARRDKKAFLSDQCKEIEENNRRGKTRNSFEKIRHTKRTCHAKMGTIKDRTGSDLTEAEEIKKRWQEYTEVQFSSVQSLSRV